MLLAAELDGKLALLTTDHEIQPGHGSPSLYKAPLRRTFKPFNYYTQSSSGLSEAGLGRLVNAKERPTEQDVLRIVMDRGNEGILQSALWREMKADSREGSRAILRLERKG